MRWLVVLFAVVSCSTQVPVPAMQSQPTSALEPVPYPPPPAHVEAVPDAPSSNARWIDGEWVWRNRRWLWQRGRWIVPPEHAKFAPWTIVRDADGNLHWARGTWRAENGEAIAEPKPLAVGADVVGSVVDSEGNTIEPGRVLPPPGARPK